MVMVAGRQKEKRWTVGQTAIAQKYQRQGKSNAEIGELLGFTRKQVCSKFASIDLKKRRIWNEYDIELLRELYPKASWRILTSRLHRTWKAIGKKANDIGISRLDDRYDWLTTIDLANILGVSEWFIKQRIYMGVIKTDKEYSSNIHKIDYKEARHYIIRYAGELANRKIDLPLVLDILGIYQPNNAINGLDTGVNLEVKQEIER